MDELASNYLTVNLYLSASTILCFTSVLPYSNKEIETLDCKKMIWSESENEFLGE